VQAPRGYLFQIKQALPEYFYQPEPELLCATCTAFESARCTLPRSASRPAR